MSDLKVFRVNDVEWWFAPSLEEAVAAAMEAAGMTSEEWRQEWGEWAPRELTPEEMDKPEQVNIAPDGEPSDLVSFRYALEVQATGERTGMLCEIEL